MNIYTGRFEATLENKLEEISNMGDRHLIISVDSDLLQDLALDDFAQRVLNQLKRVSSKSSIMNVFLCESRSRALLEAYSYFLTDMWVLQELDEEIWKTISNKHTSK